MSKPEYNSFAKNAATTIDYLLDDQSTTSSPKKRIAAFVSENGSFCAESSSRSLQALMSADVLRRVVDARIHRGSIGYETGDDWMSPRELIERTMALNRKEWTEMILSPNALLKHIGTRSDTNPPPVKKRAKYVEAVAQFEQMTVEELDEHLSHDELTYGREATEEIWRRFGT